MTTRILALHGYHGSAQVLGRQLAPLAATLPATIEFTFVDAPSLATNDFGWWHQGFAGWERSRDWVRARLRDSAERFDGVLGFSQGAALTGLLAALQNSDPPTSSDFAFAIMISGFTSTMPQHAALFERPVTIPSLHLMGRADHIVPIRDSALLAGRFADPVLIEHAGGHVIPSDPRTAASIRDFLSGHAAGTHTEAFNA